MSREAVDEMLTVVTSSATAKSAAQRNADAELLARNVAQTDLILSLNSQVAALSAKLETEYKVTATLSDALDIASGYARYWRRVLTMIEKHNSVSRQLRAALHAAGINPDA